MNNLTSKTIAKLSTFVLFLALCLAPTNSSAQVSVMETSVVKDGYVMIDGKMMTLKSGKLTPMKKTVTMENGTKIKKNGRVRTSEGKKERMKDGNCIDYTGKIESCNVNSQHYTCTMHKDVRAAKGGKCPKCGMALVSKN